MVATFARLKLRLITGALRGSKMAKFGMVSVAFVGLIMAVLVWVGAIVIRVEGPEFGPPWTVIVFGVLVMGWFVLPLLAGFTDGTIDPSRLVHLPITDRQMAKGLLAAALVGIPPLVTILAVLAALVLVGSVAQAIFVVAACIVAVSTCVVLAQLGSATMSAFVRSRRLRDAASAVLAMLGMLVGFGYQFVISRVAGLSVEQLDGVARWVRWLPGGWIGQAIVWSGEGRWGIALLALAASAVFAAGALQVWGSVLRRVLTTPADHQTARAVGENTFVLPWLNWLPDQLAITTTRGFKTLRRDNREWMGIVAMLPLLMFLAIPLVGVREGEATLLLGSIGIYGGLINGSLLAFDGSSIWMEQLSASSMRPLIFGKSLVRGLIIVPLVVIVGLALAVFTGGWRYLIAGLSLAFCSFGTMSGAGAVASVRFAAAIPDNANPWNASAGQSAGNGLASIMLLFVSLAAVLPVSGLVVGLSFVRWWLGALVAPIAIAWGWWCWQKGIDMASSEAEAAAPELLGRLTWRG